ncbi:MAG: hypothetical protein HXX17_02470 [Geobacteraceae bacterium]|nr:hypothetical protein [Geobacteraceae bacterium]
MTQHKSNVVTGLLYGYGARTPISITGEGQPSVSPTDYFSLITGRYAIADYKTYPPPNEHIFTASFSDNTRLYSVWSGIPTASADIETIFDQLGISSPSSLTVAPDIFNARANINPLTDLAYWYWLHENKQSPYYYYQTGVFLFFRQMYSLPEQDIVHDYPSPELKQLLDKIEIKTSASGFALIERASGITICQSTFALFPVCQ